MLEYLAAGLPVVASNLPAVRDFGEAMAIADTAEDWESALDAAINGRGKGSPALGLAVAKANSWDVRAARLKVLLQRMVSQRSSSHVAERADATV